ncbi:hypothetical protein Goari_016988, partial [Gossypium aridum]|nr:hypothetical protein [Gossypium aridum]
MASTVLVAHADHASTVSLAFSFALILIFLLVFFCFLRILWVVVCRLKDDGMDVLDLWLTISWTILIDTIKVVVKLLFVFWDGVFVFNVSTMAEDINNLFSRLTFTEEEANQVVGMNKLSPNFHGHEAWAVGKVMSTEKINREAMYRVLHNREGEPLLEIGKGKAKVDEEASDSSSVTDRRLKRAPKEGRSHVSGRCKSRVAMKEFGKVLDELALIDIKPDKGRKPTNDYKDPRLFFKYEACWLRIKMLRISSKKSVK